MKEKSARMNELIKQLNHHNYLYFTLNTPMITDGQYDRLFDELKELESETGIVKANSPTQKVGGEVLDSFKKVQHTTPLLSLEKTKDISKLTEFVKNQECLFMLKYDGLTVKLVYSNGELVSASTRGNGEVGEDITANAKTFKNIPLKIPYKKKLVVVGEALILAADFEKHSAEDNGNAPKNPRNFAAGSVRCLDSNICKERDISFFAFNVLEGFEEYPSISRSKVKKLLALHEFGFEILPVYLLSPDVTESEIAETIDTLKEFAKIKGIPIDGLVLSYNDIEYSKSLGRTNHHYKDGIAFKFEDEIYETTLRDIEWNTSRFGIIAPVAIFDSVMIDGCEVSRASLHNLNFIERLELFIGCRIIVSKRNMIIPHIEENLDRGNGKYILPSSCLACGKETKIEINEKTDSKNLICTNPNCKSKFINKLIHFTGKKALDIEGLSEATLEKFVENGWVEKLTDIFLLNRFEIEITNLAGFGEKSFKNLIYSIKKSKTTTFQRYLIALDIPLLGNNASETLKSFCYSDVKIFLEAVETKTDFSQIEGIGDIINQNIHNWFSFDENSAFALELLEFLNIETEAPLQQSEAISNNLFSGKTVVVTGKVTGFTRDGMRDFLISMGAKVTGSVSSKTDILIVGDKAGSKLAKAKELGIKVMEESEFLQAIKN